MVDFFNSQVVISCYDYQSSKDRDLVLNISPKTKFLNVKDLSNLKESNRVTVLFNKLKDKANSAVSIKVELE